MSDTGRGQDDKRNMVWHGVVAIGCLLALIAIQVTTPRPAAFWWNALFVGACLSGAAHLVWWFARYVRRER